MLKRVCPLAKILWLLCFRFAVEGAINRRRTDRQALKALDLLVSCAGRGSTAARGNDGECPCHLAVAAWHALRIRSVGAHLLQRPGAYARSTNGAANPRWGKALEAAPKSPRRSPPPPVCLPHTICACGRRRQSVLPCVSLFSQSILPMAMVRLFEKRHDLTLRSQCSVAHSTAASCRSSEA
jgi:hypothetical protein